MFDSQPREKQMKATTLARSSGEILRHWVVAMLVLAAGVLYALGTTNAYAAPAAGTVIGNQATATYNDAGGAPRTATSNLVTTTVSQVKIFTLTANGARTAAPGQTVYYPHTITNTGNGVDTYALNAPTSTNFATPAAPHGSLAYYIDANGDGVPDNATPINTSGALAAGGIFRFVVGGTVPGGAASGNTADIGVSVTDTNTAPTTLANTDTTTVANSVIVVTKALSSNSGPSPAGPITVTLSYTNSGTAIGTNVQLTDALPAGMTYVAGSGRWSVSGATVLTDANDGIEQAGPFPPGIDYRAAAGTVTAIIPSVPQGVSGTVTFSVNINPNLQAQTINNTAQFQTATQVSTNTNTASYQVLQTAAVVANGSPSSSVNFPTAGSGEPVTVPSAAAGSTFSFNNYIWNRGNGTDTFDITIQSNNFPAGTSVTLLQQDGITSLVNSAGSGAPDTGPVPGVGQPCAAPFVTDGTYCGYRVVVRVTVPATGSGGPYSITKRATSVFNNTVFDDVTDTLTLIAANTVDVTNNSARTDSTPPGTAAAGNAPTSGWGTTGAAVITTNAVSPSTSGTTASRFQLWVNNTGLVSDSFNLSTTFAATTAAGVTAPTLPVGWSVVFRSDGGAANCSTVGGTLTTTGALAAGANRLVCAEVTIPATTSGGAIPGNYDFDFRVTSSTNAAVFDSKRDRVTVNVTRAIIISPNNTQQTFPGGSVTYTHTITNSGNAADTANFTAGCLSDTRAAQGWTSTAYIDANANGVLDVGVDTLISCGATSLALNVAESRALFVRVFAPPSATGADPANLTAITATFGVATTSATDSTSVTDGLVLLKDQTLVACAAAGPHAGYTTAAIAAGPGTAPGQCIAYRITGTNSTAGTITSVAISDIVPANTKMRFSCSGNGLATPSVSPGSMAGGSAADGATGTVIANVGPLTSTQSAVLYFCVRIDP
jgi:uncharacterized repeat protein (TIGR01451 family)